MCMRLTPDQSLAFLPESQTCLVPPAFSVVEKGKLDIPDSYKQPRVWGMTRLTPNGLMSQIIWASEAQALCCYNFIVLAM